MLPAATSLISGAANLLGGEEKKTYTIDDLIKYGYKPYDEQNEISNLHRYSEAMKKDRRSNTNQKLASEGYSATGSIYTNEEDILNSTMQGEQQIKKTAANERNKIAQYLFGLNEGQEDEDSDIMKFISGATSGLAGGMSLADLFKKVPGGSAG